MQIGTNCDIHSETSFLLRSTLFITSSILLSECFIRLANFLQYSRTLTNICLQDLRFFIHSLARNSIILLICTLFSIGFSINNSFSIFLASDNLLRAVSKSVPIHYFSCVQGSTVESISNQKMGLIINKLVQSVRENSLCWTYQCAVFSLVIIYVLE